MSDVINSYRDQVNGGFGSDAGKPTEERPRYL